MRQIIITTALLALSSCFSIQHDYSGQRELTPGTTLSFESSAIAQVEAKKRAHFLFWGLVPLNSSSGPQSAEAQAIADHGEDFDGIARLNIREEVDFLDGLTAFITLGIFSMRSVETTGEVRRYGEGVTP